MSVYAPDLGKDHKNYENSWIERRKFYWIDDGMGAKRFYIAVDFDIEDLALRYVWTPALARIWNGPRRLQQIDVRQHYERI